MARFAGTKQASSAMASRNVPATANVNLNATLNASGNLMFISPTYTFATPVLGGQLAVGVIGAFGR